MILKRFFDDKLAQASYLIGCPGAGEAIVIDPNRDAEQYIEAAASEHLRIVGVTETHIHADYASGSLELAERTDSTLYLSGEGDADWQYAFGNRPNVNLVHGGDQIKIGALRFDIVHTPGHTPEHIAFILTDEANGPEPCCMFSGDFIFAGDVGRPDLLERAANMAGTMEKGAKVLYNSIQSFKNYPGHILIWPGHGAGSACGKSLSGVPATTLGYELATNWALKSPTESDFIRNVLSGQPDPPTYFKEMKRINKIGPNPAPDLSAPARLGGKLMLEAMDRGDYVIDARESEEVAAGYAPGTLHIPLGNAFNTWAGWLVPYDKPIYILANNETEAAEARRDLAMIGLDNVRGWFGHDALEAFASERGDLETVPQIQPEEIENLNGVALLDVRRATEVTEGTIQGATPVPLGELSKRIAEVPKDKPLLVFCAGGRRSSIAISLLRKHGFKNVSNLVDGYSNYEERMLIKK